jgi:hypothetical protein
MMMNLLRIYKYIKSERSNKKNCNNNKKSEYVMTGIFTSTDRPRSIKVIDVKGNREIIIYIRK